MKRLSLTLVAGLLLACDGGSKSQTTPEKPAAPRVDAAKAADPAVPKAEPAPLVELEVGKPAPAFELTDLDGKTHRLEDYKGKTVVLEWFNPGCPFVKYAHENGPLKDMAKRTTDAGVVWLAINSNAEGKQGHGVEANREAAKGFGMAHPILLDPSGEVGRRYGAEKTPHMFLIDAEGTLRYRGAIDNAPMGEVDGEGEKVNYVEQALAAVKGGSAPKTTQTPAYGCTVKYAS